jgi:hypothetical protein
MKLKQRFLIAILFVSAIYVPAVHGQVNLTFSGGNNTPLQITLQQSVTYTTTTSNCVGVANGPLFVFDGVGNLLGGYREVTGGTVPITYSINGGASIFIDSAQTNSSAGNNVTADDLLLYSLSRPGVSSGDMVVLSAGTVITTGFNYAGAPPAAGSFPTFLTNQSGVRCSENGVAAGTTAASVSINGRVLTNSRRGLSNALVYLTDSEGNTRTARTNSLGYYRFNDIAAGQSVTVTVVSKRYQFAPQILNLNEEMNGVNFLADN